MKEGARSLENVPGVRHVAAGGGPVVRSVSAIGASPRRFFDMLRDTNE